MACACKKNRVSKIEDNVTVEPVDVQEVVRKRIINTGDKSKYILDNTTSDITVEPVVIDEPVVDTKEKSIKTTAKSMNDAAGTLADAREINLEQCYLCAKKHVERARDFFEEYHTGYPDHMKNLIESVHVAEMDVRKAFIQWQRIMGQLNMGEGELLGRDANQLTMRTEHIALANKIREERLHLSDDPLYVPNFDDLLVEIHLLQHRVIDNG